MDKDDLGSVLQDRSHSGQAPPCKALGAARIVLEAANDLEDHATDWAEA